jgi:phosphate transport system permease protein
MTTIRERVHVTLPEQASHLTTPAGKASRALSWGRLLREWLTHRFFVTMTTLTCALLLVLVALLLILSWPLLIAYPLPTLLAGERWLPNQGLFGFAPFIWGSVIVTVLALVIAVPPALLSGIYLSEYTNTRTRNLLKPLLDLLVGIPSVVYGLWGVLFVVPLIRDHVGPWSDSTLGQWLPLFARTNRTGYGLLSASLVLAIMVFPFIVAIVDEVMRTVPTALRESALALGATRWETTKLIVRRSAASGLAAAVILGFSRAFGETLAVMMLVGNTPQIPRSLFDAAYPLPALIANNYGEMMSVPLYEGALMTAALLLLGVVLLFNIGTSIMIHRRSAQKTR